MEKNDLITAAAVSLGSNGEGIVHCDGFTCFVPRLLPGEKAVIRILKCKGKIAYGKVEELLTPAEDRVRPQCPVFERCGGCQLQHLRYRAQLRFKTQLVRETLRKIGGVEFPVNECEKSEREYGYRNKLQLPIGNRNGQNVIGFYAERTHRIVKTDVCPIHPEWSAPLIKALYSFMETCGLDGYDEETGKGQLRHIVVRELKGKYLVTLVTAIPEIKGIDYLLFLLDGIFPEYSFYLNLNDKRTNVVFGEKFTLLKGKGFYECTEGGVTYEAGASTFVQVNEGVRGKLYERVLSFAEAGEAIVDCYAGGGLLTAMLAKKCGRAYGIEIVPEASLCADRVKDKNGLSGRMHNICGRVEDYLAEILAREPNAAVVLDPPRAGVDRSVLHAISAQEIGKIVMISCDPATLARDLGILTGGLTETASGELVKADPAEGKYGIELI
ncbi:MAG: 23S rRNA (uracil(1939)-C(5))-methyltransferase RlmD, partial [Clostridia bacterium]|nr:23S rRNA (uracil(1939)-C(5))-methyltransferase RlmD [Clostridia bacterium]